ncbi:MAG: NYN domain-containing protein [Nanoarchaeota archaeon]|nr:NYN domain-containing protein [Nanoarchaeota archaeon]
MNNKESDGKAIVFIDAGYLSKISKYLGGGKYLRYNIQSFAVNICKKLGYWCEEICYYTAPPFQSHNPTKEEIDRKKGYDGTISKIKQSGFPPVRIREGRLQKIGNLYKQKGVDTIIAFDLLRYSQIKQHEAIVLITADTDFVPIIRELKEMYSTKLFLAYFTDLIRKSSFSLSNELWEVFDNNKIRIEKDDFFMNKI